MKRATETNHKPPRRGKRKPRKWFSANRKLLLKIEDEARKSIRSFRDYRAAGSVTSILEPHRIDLSVGGTGELTFLLQKANYNAGIKDSAFESPSSREVLDVPWEETPL